MQTFWNALFHLHSRCKQEEYARAKPRQSSKRRRRLPRSASRRHPVCKPFTRLTA